MKNFVFVFTLFFSAPSFAQDFFCDNAAINNATRLAIKTVDINIRRGILAAGADYGGEWTRDIAINSWNGVSLLRPQVAEESLWSVTLHKDTIGHQYWDKIIWVIAALNHYKVTGDKAFLSQAYTCSANTMKQLEEQTFDAKYGLFNGPSVFNDGIAAYPEPIYEPSNTSSSVLDHKGSALIKCLSTNCIYYGAYNALNEMGTLLKIDKPIAAAYVAKAVALKKNIRNSFYNQEANTFNYLIDQNGKVDKSQEALGISFAILSGIVDREEANKIVSQAVVSKFGITSVYPDFPRYSADKPGRHNNIVWPMVNGFFANASLHAGNDSSFNHELFSLTGLALDADKGDYDFREIYNPLTGKPDGGWQANGPSNPDFHWASCKLQTWSATAYLSMIMKGLFGLSVREQSLVFSPYLPAGIGNIQLKNFAYRNATLNIAVKGTGKKIKSFLLDGKSQSKHSIDSGIKGRHTIVIELNLKSQKFF